VRDAPEYIDGFLAGDREGEGPDRFRLAALPKGVVDTQAWCRPEQGRRQL